MLKWTELNVNFLDSNMRTYQMIEKLTFHARLLDSLSYLLHLLLHHRTPTTPLSWSPPTNPPLRVYMCKVFLLLTSAIDPSVVEPRYPPGPAVNLWLRTKTRARIYTIDANLLLVNYSDFLLQPLDWQEERVEERGKILEEQWARIGVLN